MDSPATGRGVLAALLALTLSGCGGSASSPQAPATPPPTPTPTPEPAGTARLVGATLARAVPSRSA